MERIAIVEGIRTPFCKMGTTFNNLSAVELGRIAARELIERMSLDVKQIDEVAENHVILNAKAIPLSISMRANLLKRIQMI